MAGATCLPWPQALEAARLGTLSFEGLVRCAGGRIERAVRVWVRRFPQAFVSPEDVRQEALLAIWQAVQSWSPDGGRSLTSWVSYRMNIVLKRQAFSYRHLVKKDQRYFTALIVEEFVVYDAGPREFHTLTDSELEARCDAAKQWPVAYQIVGAMRPDQARVIAALLRGEHSLDGAAECVYGSRQRSHRRAALRAIAAARALVECSLAPEGKRKRHGPNHHEKD